MFTCHATKTKGATTQIHCQDKAPAKTKPAAKAHTAKHPSVQVGHPGSQLGAVTGGKSQAKSAVKGGAIVFAEDKIQPSPKPTAKEAAKKKVLARNFIGDFGMIQVAKDSGKTMPKSAWGQGTLLLNPANAKLVAA